MANPPQAGKMTPERPFPALFETGKSSPKARFTEKHPLYAPNALKWPVSARLRGLPEPL